MLEIAIVYFSTLDKLNYIGCFVLCLTSLAKRYVFRFIEAVGFSKIISLHKPMNNFQSDSLNILLSPSMYKNFQCSLCSPLLRLIQLLNHNHLDECEVLTMGLVCFSLITRKSRIFSYLLIIWMSSLCHAYSRLVYFSNRLFCC